MEISFYMLFICTKFQGNRVKMRLILEYASTVWAPYTKSNIEKLESVLQGLRCLIMIFQVALPVFWTRHSLEVKRQFNRLMMLYRIMQGSAVTLDLPHGISFMDTVTWGHNRRYKAPFSRIDIHKFSFFPATIRLWNSLPDLIVNLDSPEAFHKSATNFLNKKLFLYLIIYLLYLANHLITYLYSLYLYTHILHLHSFRVLQLLF